MAHVSGPVRTLPGHRSAPPDGTECDDHPGVLAATRIQGETDSFGAEYLDLCTACVARLSREQAAPGYCDWCKAQVLDLRPRRDPDEGSCGRVYQVCQPCRRAQTLREIAECDDWIKE